MAKDAWVVTNPELGWDCVLAVEYSQEDAEYHQYNDDDYTEDGTLKEGAEPNDMVIVHGPF